MLPAAELMGKLTVEKILLPNAIERTESSTCRLTEFPNKSACFFKLKKEDNMILLFANRSVLSSRSSQHRLPHVRDQRIRSKRYDLKEGELGRGFCILDEGVVEVIRDNKILNEIGQKGAIFGELSEILMYKKEASVRAKDKTKVKYFDNKLEQLVAENPKFAVKMIRNLADAFIT